MAALAAFVVLVMFAGGSARADNLSLIFLRPLSCGFLAYALLAGSSDHYRSVRVPLALLGGLAILIFSQLVPLPHSIWADLPGHGDYAEAAELAGIGPAWRPLTLSPSRTLNSFLALFVPFAALCLATIQPRQNEDYPVVVLVAAATLSAVWALLQLSGLSDATYLYAVTNKGAAVGLLANRNHQSVLLGASLPFLAHLYLVICQRASRDTGGGVILLAIASLMVFVSLSTGSRAGFIAVGIGIVLSCIILAPQFAAGKGSEAARRVVRRVVGVIFVVGLALVLTPILLGRMLALERLWSTEPIEELRVAILPQVLDMIGDSFPTGTGFGTFELVYYKYEPLTALSRYYINHAHNDWLEIVLEGGALTIVLLGLFLGWIVKRALMLARAAQRNLAWSRGLACLGFIIICGLASFVDYPLRTPIFSALFAICCIVLARSNPNVRARSG